MNKPKRREALIAILEWLYTNDQAYDSKLEWRIAFIDFLKKLLEWGGIMPFKKITRGKNKGKYKSPSGRVWTKKQVIAYHASGGTFSKARKRKKK